MKVTVLGLWHLGSVTAACCAKHFSVVGLDFDQTAIVRLQAGQAPIAEPGLNEALQMAENVKPKLAKLQKATQDFEAVFLKNLLASMRRGMPGGGLEAKSFGGDIYRDMLDDELAKSASQSGTLGVGKILYKQLAPLAIAQEQARLRAEKAIDTKA